MLLIDNKVKSPSTTQNRIIFKKDTSSCYRVFQYFNFWQKSNLLSRKKKTKKIFVAFVEINHFKIFVYTKVKQSFTSLGMKKYVPEKFSGSAKNFTVKTNDSFHLFHKNCY